MSQYHYVINIDKPGLDVRSTMIWRLLVPYDAVWFHLDGHKAKQRG
jgi:hypothetical protein